MAQFAVRPARRSTIQRFLLIQGAGFVVAASTHFGLLVDGYQHRQASIAESVIAAALLSGLALTLVWPGRTDLIGFVAQAFALLGTLVGVVMVAIGVGPHTAPDIVFHIAILAVLAWGLVVTGRTRGDGGRQSS